MAFAYPTDLKYMDSHEYARVEGDQVTVGITEFAVDQLGDIVFLELPQVGDTVTQGEKFGTVESVKAVEDMYAPISGEVVAVNEALVDAPEALGEDPYGEAWLLKVKASDISGLDKAMDATAYQAAVEGH
jgi:glycine cleavage system H protein